MYFVNDISFVFNNATSASHSVNDVGGGVVTSSNIVGWLALTSGGALSFGLDSQRNNLVLVNRVNVTTTIHTKGILFYT